MIATADSAIDVAARIHKVTSRRAHGEKIGSTQ
jgi:hypothetical protein